MSNRENVKETTKQNVSLFKRIIQRSVCNHLVKMTTTYHVRDSLDRHDSRVGSRTAAGDAVSSTGTFRTPGAVMFSFIRNIRKPDAVMLSPQGTQCEPSTNVHKSPQMFC